MRGFLALRYILGEMIPTFLVGVLIFVFILLMFQALRLTEFVIVHGVKITTIAQLMAYLSTSFLPILFPMSLLFTVLLTYSHLSSNAEIVAFRAVGLSMRSIMAPAVILSMLIGLVSLQTSFHIAPWGNRQFEVLFTQLGAMRPGVTIKEGTFSEGFFDMVVYANKVDSKTGRLSGVFIYNEKDEKTPVTVIAREGHLLVDTEKPGHSASLRLIDGNIHRTSVGRHTKINFNTYDIFLTNPVTEAFRNKSMPSLTIDEVRETLADPQLPPKERRAFETEYHKRLAIALACILFALIGVGLGTVSNRRNVKSGSSVICVALIVVYWVIYVTAEGFSQSGKLPPWIAMWLANGVFSIAAFFSLRSAWH